MRLSKAFFKAKGKEGGSKTAQRGSDFYREIGAKGNKAQGKKV